MKFIPLASFERINSLLECVEHSLEQGVLLTLHLEAFTCRHTREEKEIAHQLVAYYNEVLSTPPLGPSCTSHANENIKPLSHHSTLPSNSCKEEKMEEKEFALTLPPLILGSTPNEEEDASDKNEMFLRNSNVDKNNCNNKTENTKHNNVSGKRNEVNTSHGSVTNASHITTPFTISDIDNRLIYFVAALNSVYGDDGYDFSVLSEQDFICYDEMTFKDKVNQQLPNLPEKCLPALRSLWTSIEEQVMTAPHGCEYYEFNCPSCDPCNEIAITSHHYFLYNKRRKVIVLMRLITQRANQSRRLMQGGNTLINVNSSDVNREYDAFENNNDEFDDDEEIKQRRWLAWKKDNVYTMECDDDDELNDEDCEFSNEYD